MENVAVQIDNIRGVFALAVKMKFDAILCKYSAKFLDSLHIV